MPELPESNPPIVQRTPALPLHDWHVSRGAIFEIHNQREQVAHYGDPGTEFGALGDSVALFDLSGRGRLCLLGSDRAAFLHGQVTNDVKGLKPGSGNHAALISARGKMESDLRVYALQDELLLDLEPGYDSPVAARLEKYVISEDVQIIDASPYYALLSLQGPEAANVLAEWAGDEKLLPASLHSMSAVEHEAQGKCYFAREDRLGAEGFDLYIPVPAIAEAANSLLEIVEEFGGCAAGSRAWEASRLMAGVPRYGADMDETTLPPEAGLENRAISYSKGCYIGQEIIARIRTYGQVAKVLRGLRLTGTGFPTDPVELKLVSGDREIGRVTSLEDRRVTGNNTPNRAALGYVRKEHKELGTRLEWICGELKGTAEVISLPFESLPMPQE